MSALSFVLVQPGKVSTAASKHEARVGIHSHAQRVTQARKREKRLQEQEKKQKISDIVRRSTPDGKAAQFDGEYKVNTLSEAVAIRFVKSRPYGLPTPPPEVVLTRPRTNYATWTTYQKNGIQLFLQRALQDINPMATNMDFWKFIIPGLSDTCICVRDLVAAVAYANQAISSREEDMILTALNLERHAIALLKRDLMKLPLSAQVTCLLLFDALNLLRCDFASAGSQVMLARKLTEKVSVEVYLEDDKLLTVCDALARMSQSSTWSLWSPQSFLRYESLRHVEPTLNLEIQSIQHTEGSLQDITAAMGRLARQLSGRVWRNLSELSCIDRQSRFARDVLKEFRLWEAAFDDYKRKAKSEEREIIQQAEMAYRFTYITFTAGVLSSNPSMMDHVEFEQYFDRITQIAEQRFHDSQAYSHHEPIKPFMQIVVPTLWLTILWRRDPMHRRRAINILKSQEYIEGEFISTVTAKIAQTVVDIEQHGVAAPTQGWEITPSQRVTVEDLKYVPESNMVVLKYSQGTRVPKQGFHFQNIDWNVEIEDRTRFNTAIRALAQNCVLYKKVPSDDAPDGVLKPMYYHGELVPVLTEGGRRPA